MLIISLILIIVIVIVIVIIMMIIIVDLPMGPADRARHLRRKAGV